MRSERQMRFPNKPTPHTTKGIVQVENVLTVWLLCRVLSVTANVKRDILLSRDISTRALFVRIL